MIQNSDKSFRFGMRRGSVLPLAVVVVVLLSLLGLSLLAIGKHVRFRAIATMHDTTARCAADAGLAHAQYLAMRAYKAFPWPGVAAVTDAPLDGANAAYSYTVTGTPPNGITIEGVGNCMDAERKVYCLMTEKADIVGIGAEGRIKFFANLTVRGRGAVLRTNSAASESIVIGKGSVAANLVAGPGATVEDAIKLGIGGGGGAEQVKLDGTKSVAEERVDYPQVSWPSPVPGTPLPSGTAEIPASGTYTMPGTNAGMVIRRPANVVLYMDGNINVGNQVGFLVESGATLTLYANGNIVGNNGVRFYSDDLSDPAKVAQSILIYGTENCKVVELKNNAASYALLYVPSANVEFMNNATLYGALIVNTIEAKNNAIFHYIPELRNILSAFLPMRLFVERWWEG